MLSPTPVKWELPSAPRGPLRRHMLKAGHARVHGSRGSCLTFFQLTLFLKLR